MGTKKIPDNGEKRSSSKENDPTSQKRNMKDKKITHIEEQLQQGKRDKTDRKRKNQINQV